MVEDYLWLKFLHLVLVFAGLGVGIATGLLLQFFGDHPTHGPFVLRAARKLQMVVVLPGYVLMLASGMWIAYVAHLLDAYWTETAMNIWGIGAVLMAASFVMLNRRLRLLESQGPSSTAYRRASLWNRLLGGGAGAAILTIVYLMVLKPSH